MMGFGYRDYESIYVGEALASNSRLKPLQYHIKTMAYKIKKLFLCCFHNTFTVSIASTHLTGCEKTCTPTYVSIG